MAWTFLKAFPEYNGVNRTCRRCHLIQMVREDGKTWKERV